MYSRWANELQLPNYILDQMPSDMWLDGEISFTFSYAVITLIFGKFGLEENPERDWRLRK